MESTEMPKAFDRCVKRGGKVRTVKPKPGTYMRVCKPSGGKKSVAGHVKRTRRGR